MLNINEEISNNYPWGKKIWAKRTRAIGRIVSRFAIKKHGAIRVLDVGGGLGNLYAYLPANTDYISIDILPWHDRTIVFDFNSKKQHPKIDIVDIIVCQGVIEYMKDPVDFFSRMRSYGERMILTFRPATDELHHNRTNATISDVRKALTIAGWESNVRCKIGVETVMICHTI